MLYHAVKVVLGEEIFASSDRNQKPYLQQAERIDSPKVWLECEGRTSVSAAFNWRICVIPPLFLIYDLKNITRIKIKMGGDGGDRTSKDAELWAGCLNSIGGWVILEGNECSESYGKLVWIYATRTVQQDERQEDMLLQQLLISWFFSFK